MITQRTPMYLKMKPEIKRALSVGGPMSSREIYEKTQSRISPTHNTLVWFLKRMKIEGELIKVSQNSKRIIWGLPK